MIRTPNQLALSALLVTLVTPVLAQTRPQTATGATLPLPEGVNRVISIDAQNSLLVESGTPGQETYTLFPIRHVYSGGIAQLFGGTSIPTEQFVSPGISGGGNRRGGFGAVNARGGTGGAGLMQGGTTGGNFGGFNRTGGGTTVPLFGVTPAFGRSISAVAAVSPPQLQREGN